MAKAGDGDAGVVIMDIDERGDDLARDTKTAEAMTATLRSGGTIVIVNAKRRAREAPGFLPYGPVWQRITKTDPPAQHSRFRTLSRPGQARKTACFARPAKTLGFCTRERAVG